MPWVISRTFGCTAFCLVCVTDRKGKLNSISMLEIIEKVHVQKMSTRKRIPNIFQLSDILLQIWIKSIDFDIKEAK